MENSRWDPSRQSTQLTDGWDGGKAKHDRIRTSHIDGAAVPSIVSVGGGKRRHFNPIRRDLRAWKPA
ncbi:MAG TPA: hypothetical protein DDX19_13345 [Rhodopirellula baltica]|uniref:Uncharacterized protein n=2 Tax=Rhodopirellula baltica TaxID=265606 RepID=Q7UJU3_RHOBA|nr:hypothetical protein RBSH_00051 [Rhodopirellula baltica SH28]CAD77138.1 hypothetical protein RB11060 [Rhodopirellula baltica SH 1]HBE63694.1 hypothetical protein [Rhodopirellula baltica]